MHFKSEKITCDKILPENTLTTKKTFIFHKYTFSRNTVKVKLLRSRCRYKKKMPYFEVKVHMPDLFSHEHSNFKKTGHLERRGGPRFKSQ